MGRALFYKGINTNNMNKKTISAAMNERPEHMPTRNNSVITYIAMFFWWLSGWRTVGSLPNEKKILVAAAPHTSNWDFIVGLPIILTLGIKGSIMMKKEAFIWPFSYLWRWIGFIPIDRHSPKGAVGAAVEYFENNEATTGRLTLCRTMPKWEQEELPQMGNLLDPEALVGMLEKARLMFADEAAVGFTTAAVMEEMPDFT